MKRNFISIISLVFIGFIITLSSCLKKEFDTPPDESGYDPKLTVTHSIADFKSLPQGEMITDDVIISGVVCMDDESGNYYKKIVIQDATGGIEVLIDQTNLYTDYPVGRKVYIRCKGLYLGSYNELPQLGYTPDERGTLTQINGTMIGDYIVKANFPNVIKVDTFDYADLSSIEDSRLNTLVALRNVQFTDGDAGIPYTPPTASDSRNLTDCSSSDIEVRTSNYAKFQSFLTPKGNGVIVGVYTRYRNTPQIIIRDTSDVRFYNARCQ
ncbi:MAG: DUF5689 domain-containing protein [Taibaiella sp.]|jgi:hypothetical protein